MADLDRIQKFYIAYYGRPADTIGLEYWANALDVDLGGDQTEMVKNFGSSEQPEYQNLYGTNPIADFIKLVYQNLFNRAVETDGLNYWLGVYDTKISQGEDPNLIRANMVTFIMDGAQDTGTTKDATTVANKLTVAKAFTTAVDTPDEVSAYSNVQNTAGQAAARALLQTVTSDQASVTAATANVDSTLVEVVDGAGSAGTGQTFVLTKSVQALTGTTGNDTFIAGDDGGSATLNAGDSISGAGGTDTLKIFNSAATLNAANFIDTVTSSVEYVEATMGASAQKLDVSANADVQKVTLVNGFDGVVTLKAAQTAGLSGAVNTKAPATFTFSDVAGGADTASLALTAADLTTNGNKGLTIAGVETLNVAATGINMLGNTALAATTKLVITGDGSVKTTLTGTLAKTIDGSASTGNLDIDNKAAAAAVQNIKTGSGNDVYTTRYAHLTADDAIDMGTGTDSLRFADAATFNSPASNALLTKVAGVEQLGTVNALLTVDGDFVTQTSFYTEGAAGDFALTNLKDDAVVNYGAGAILAGTAGMKPGAEMLNVNLAGSNAGASDVGNGLTVTGSSIIYVNSSGTAGQPNNVLNLTAADSQSVVVSGSQNLTLTTTAAQGATGISIGGAAFTGKLDVTGTAATDFIVGGSGSDRLSGGAGATVADVLVGNAGNDRFAIIAGATATTFDSIFDFVTKADTISFSGGAAGSAANYTEGAAAVADFTAALAAANAVLVGGGAVYNVQQVGSDSYLFHDVGGAGGADQAVKLIGVALTGIEFGDIVV